MEIIQAIKTRKSIRGFLPREVPKDVLKEIIATSLRAPSTMNTQPWSITVVTGKALDSLKKGNIEKLTSGIEQAPETTHISFQEVHRQRQVDLAKQIFQIMDIPREDKQKRTEWGRRGFRYFDAPAAIILSIDRALDQSPMSLLDMGLLAQNICLAALNYGLGTCIQDQGVKFPDLVRKVTGLPESKRIVICIAIGYPDWDFPANKLESERESIENVINWRDVV